MLTTSLSISEKLCALPKKIFMKLLRYALDVPEMYLRSEMYLKHVEDIQNVITEIFFKCALRYNWIKEEICH